MKRDTKILLGVASLILFAVVLGIVLNAHYAVAEEPVVPDVLGINPENIDKLPQTPEEAAAKGSAYLKQEWQKILANNTVIGPIHRWSMNNQGVYTFLFNEEYDLSLKFFLIFVFWWFIFIFIANTFGALDAFGFGGSVFPGIFVGFGVCLGLAHIKFFNLIVSWILTITTFARGSWWKELIVWLVLIIIFVFIYSFGDIWKKSRKEAKEKAEKKEIKTRTEESKEFIKGVEEGQEVTKELRKIKKKAFLDEGAEI